MEQQTQRIGTTKPERNADEAPVFSTRVGHYFGSYRMFSGAAVPEPANVADTCSDHTGSGTEQDLWNRWPTTSRTVRHSGA